MKIYVVLLAVTAGILFSSCSSSLRFSSEETYRDKRISGSGKAVNKDREGQSCRKPGVTINKIKSNKYSENESEGADIADIENDNSFENDYADILSGKASYYADKFNGRLTANGEVFDNEKFTAAHKTLPFGTNVLVKNLRNNKTVQVRINDRGPFVDGRIIDLSRIAAEQIGMIRSGIADVEVIVLSE